ncbi:hypothetical protein BD779DRAFT_1490495 [Infundibulicybe gibba]|nr:hypothetical protein BD779DRAFT_1490495 [Infundibulicybe gibba]
MGDRHSEELYSINRTNAACTTVTTGLSETVQRASQLPITFHPVFPHDKDHSKSQHPVPSIIYWKLEVIEVGLAGYGREPPLWENSILHHQQHRCRVLAHECGDGLPRHRTGPTNIIPSIDAGPPAFLRSPATDRGEIAPVCRGRPCHICSSGCSNVHMHKP